MMHSDSDAHHGAGPVSALPVLLTRILAHAGTPFDVVNIKETGRDCCMSITLCTQKHIRPAMILCMILCNTVQC